MAPDALAQEGTPQPLYDFFISYAPADEPWAIWIAGQLEHAGYHIFIHAWDMRPGHNLILNIHAALLHHPRVLLIVSPNLPQENLPQAEWASAFWQDLTGEKQALVPIRVVPCKLGGLLAPLQPLDLFDLSEQDALASLFAGISTERNRATEPHPSTGSFLSLFFPGAPRPHTRRIFQAPDLPKSYIPRPGPYNEIKRHLLTQLGGQTTSITTALRGAGGFGKTTLATALCHDPEIQTAFPDGILWIELGESPPGELDLLNRRLVALETDHRLAATKEEARGRWRAALQDRVLLIVIDDVWQVTSLKPLLEGGPQCVRLVTTRDDQVLPDEAERVWVDAMEPEEAVVLLALNLPDEIQSPAFQSRLGNMATQLGCWPLLLGLAHGMLTSQITYGRPLAQALETMEHAYQKRGVKTYSLYQETERHRTIEACVAVNLRQLEEYTPAHFQASQRYAELAVFPEDTDIPLEILQYYWQGTGKLESWEVDDLCILMYRLSLLLTCDLGKGSFRLHDVLRKYLLHKTSENLPQLQERFLAAIRQGLNLKNWSEVPFSNTYLWQYLLRHLAQAQQWEELAATLVDLSFMVAKVHIRGVAELEKDLEWVMTETTGLVFPRSASSPELAW